MLSVGVLESDIELSVGVLESGKENDKVLIVGVCWKSLLLALLLELQLRKLELSFP